MLLLAAGASPPSEAAVIEDFALSPAAMPSPGRRAGAALVWEDPVPTLFRLLFVIGLLAALAYGGMWALVTFVRPQPHEISQGVPLPKGVR